MHLSMSNVMQNAMKQTVKYLYSIKRYSQKTRRGKAMLHHSGHHPEHCPTHCMGGGPSWGGLLLQVMQTLAMPLGHHKQY